MKNLIIGITHDDDGVALEDMRKYAGKISTGLAPHETSNGAPQAVGYFRIMKETSEVVKTGGKQKTVKKWVLDKKMQQALVDKTKESYPTKMPFTLLVEKPEDAFSAFMGKFNANSDLVCMSSGRGTRADEIQYTEDGNKVWIERKFEGVSGCPLEECPDFKSGDCKPNSVLRLYPDLGQEYNNFLHPYKFETGSPSSIKSIYSELSKVYQMALNAHLIDQKINNTDIKFTGLFNLRFYLEIVPFKKDGKENYAKTLKVHPKSLSSIMEKINLALGSKVEVGDKDVDLLTAATFDMLNEGDGNHKKITSASSSSEDDVEAIEDSEDDVEAIEDSEEEGKDNNKLENQ